MLSPAQFHALAPGAQVFAIDDRQRVIRGVVGPRYGAFVMVETKLRGGVTRRRLFHGRFVGRDYWRDLESLP